MKSGTVKARRDPQDKRYWQFRASQKHEVTQAERKKEASFHAKKKAEQKEVSDVWKAKHLEYLTEDDFNLPSEDEGEDEEDSELLLAWLRPWAPGEEGKEGKERQEGQVGGDDRGAGRRRATESQRQAHGLQS